MDKTNVTIKMPGRIVREDENPVSIDGQLLVERLIALLRSRKNIVNVSFQARKGGADGNATKVEILLSNEGGDFTYYED